MEALYPLCIKDASHPQSSVLVSDVMQVFFGDLFRSSELPLREKAEVLIYKIHTQGFL